MNCTSVLHAFGGHPQPSGMPVDLAMCLSVNQLLSMSPPEPTKPHCQPAVGPTRVSLCPPHFTPSSPYLLSSSLPSSPSPRVLRSCLRRDGTGLNKKHVVFADARGLALAAVRPFIPELSCPDSTAAMKPSPAELQDQQRRYRVRLGFPPPTFPFEAFLARLRERCVQLQNCDISHNTLIGKVCVSHVSIEKVVHVRVTFDSWRSHHDVHCTFLHQVPYGGSSMEVFAFGLSLPKNLDPKERVEFCVCFRPGPGATPHRDDNRGKYYTLHIDEGGSNADQGNAHCCYPVLSHRRPPSWPLRTSQSSAAELQCHQRSLSNRVGAKWKTLCSTALVKQEI